MLVKVLYFIIFITGATGLVYEVTWQKYLSRLIGSDSIATAIILAAFLGGLSVGYFVCGKISIKIKNHLKAYAIMEGIIGLWCIFFPNIYNAVHGFSRSWEFSPPTQIVVQGFFCSILLMGIPTLCMGGTIPFLTRGLSNNVKESTNVHARVYAINTAGAFFGTLLAGFFLISEYGLPLTVVGTGFINLFIFILVYVLQNWIYIDSIKDLNETEKLQHKISSSVAESVYIPKLLYIIVFLGGFYFMMLENVLIRITSFSLGSSSYTFSLIVAVFIISIATGSFVLGKIKSITKSFLFINQFLITISLFLVYMTLDNWPYFSHLIRIAFQNNIMGFWVYYLFVFVIILLLLIIPVGLMGATVPIAFHEIKKDLKNIGRNSGYLFSFNTIGNLSGSLIGGVLFYYFLNNDQIFIISILMASITTTMAAYRLSKNKLIVSSIAIAASLILFFVRPFYNEEYFGIGTFRSRHMMSYSLSGIKKFYEKFNHDGILKYYKDGPTTTVGVLELLDHQGRSDGMSIMVNGKSDSATKGDIDTLKLSAHIPALLSKKIDDIMLIGLGTGVTCGELSLYDEVKNIEVAEISPFVAKVLPLFGEYTYNVHKNPKLKINIGDAYRIIERSNKKWDLIISEPSNPWTTGVDMLFTQEFYKIAKEKLSSGGILLQWFNMYVSDVKMMGMIINTINSVFPYHHILMTGYSDALIVAKNDEITLTDIDRARKRLKKNHAVANSLKQIHINSIEDILIREIWPSTYTASIVSKHGLQTMDNPRLHYDAGKNFFFNSQINFSDIFSPKTAFHYDKFLLPGIYEDWLKFPFEKEKYEALLESLTKTIGGNRYEVMARYLKLKALLHDPNKFNFDDENLSKKKYEMLQFVISPKNDREWEKAGFRKKNIREKSETLIELVQDNRYWINPFPVDGLISILQKGITEGEDPYEKNWCSLQLISLILDEGKNKNQAKVLFENMIRYKDGSPIIKKLDKPLLAVVKIKLKNN